MVIDDHEIVQATPEDIDGILALQERNQPERGGALSARPPSAWLGAALADIAAPSARDALIGRAAPPARL